MAGMFDNVLFFYTENFYKKKDAGDDEWDCLKGKVAISILTSLYFRFTNEEIPFEKIEELPIEKKLFYWNIAKRYYSTQEDAIKATKAAYILSLITSND